MQFYLIVSAVMLFAGIYGFITRRNLLAILISIELILNAVNINFAVFNHYLYPGALEGLFFALFSIAVLFAVGSSTLIAIAIAQDKRHEANTLFSQNFATLLILGAVATALVLLRYLALFLSLALPALYVAIAMYHQEMIPYKLLQNVIDSKQSVPFSTAAETLGMLLSFELLQEAGIRLPDPVGQTVSVIGALIVGQSAVEAKVLSPIVIIVVAMAGIAGYAQPSQELGAAIRLWRVALVLGAVVLGLYGVMAGLMLLLWRLCDTENLGVSYLSPLTDSRPGSLRRAFLRPPLRKEDRK
mgnify:CR=1 FL=1